MPPPIVEKPTGPDGTYAPVSEFPWPPVLFVLSVLAGWALQRYVKVLPWPGLNDVPAKVVGWGFFVLGFGIATWALITMLRQRAEVRPHAEATVLVTSGPFRRFRNPMYVGYALILLGLADSTQNIWMAIMVPVFVGLITWLAILPEERHLEAKFGDAYREYKKTSRRWI